MNSRARFLSLAAEQRAVAFPCGETPGDREPDHAMEMCSSREVIQAVQSSSTWEEPRTEYFVEVVRAAPLEPAKPWCWSPSP
ncbi:hypothetical protein PEBR_27886 [Penicillium brasilianum]|uniref:Uncharacterized protein n=1 Tax=Penicillium brasilianum TaxID=104259 RepID=A0A1S9RVL1_PENBI|nr:hypothetical protein PEBR_27886 [Penicillium brasilianum]